MKIIYQMHISWFETEMALETLESVNKAVEYTTLPVEIKLCFNSQTFLEQPQQGTSEEMFRCLLEHPSYHEWDITWKTDNDPFYNVGDWRRDCYDKDNWTVWGESDCLVPETYFGVVEFAAYNLPFTSPFILTIQQKKMWDASWTPTEHTALQGLTIEQVRALSNKFVTGEGYLSLTELNNFNEAFADQSQIVETSYYKGDGALVCLSPNMPTPFIADGLHMCGEDTYFFGYCSKKQIKMYTVKNFMKGHNTGHPKKRLNREVTPEHVDRFKQLDTQMRTLAWNSLNTL